MSLVVGELEQQLQKRTYYTVGLCAAQDLGCRPRGSRCDHQSIRRELIDDSSARCRRLPNHRQMDFPIFSKRKKNLENCYFYTYTHTRARYTQSTRTPKGVGVFFLFIYFFISLVFFFLLLFIVKCWAVCGKDQPTCRPAGFFIFFSVGQF